MGVWGGYPQFWAKLSTKNGIINAAPKKNCNLKGKKHPKFVVFNPKFVVRHPKSVVVENQKHPKSVVLTPQIRRC